LNAHKRMNTGTLRSNISFVIHSSLSFEVLSLCWSCLFTPSTTVDIHVFYCISMEYYSSRSCFHLYSSTFVIISTKIHKSFMLTFESHWLCCQRQLPTCDMMLVQNMIIVVTLRCSTVNYDYISLLFIHEMRLILNMILKLSSVTHKRMHSLLYSKHCLFTMAISSCE
jgi:hypothetical protein